MGSRNNKLKDCWSQIWWCVSAISSTWKVKEIECRFVASLAMVSISKCQRELGMQLRVEGWLPSTRPFVQSPLSQDCSNEIR